MDVDGHVSQGVSQVVGEGVPQLSGTPPHVGRLCTADDTSQPALDRGAEQGARQDGHVQRLQLPAVHEDCRNRLEGLPHRERHDNVDNEHEIVGRSRGCRNGDLVRLVRDWCRTRFEEQRPLEVDTLGQEPPRRMCAVDDGARAAGHVGHEAGVFAAAEPEQQKRRKPIVGQKAQSLPLGRAPF